MNSSNQKSPSPQLAFSLKLKKSRIAFRSKDGLMYKWVGSHWQVLHVTEMELCALKFLAIDFPSQCSEKLAASCAATAILAADALPTAGQNSKIIPCRNGYLALGTMEVSPAVPEIGLTYCLNCDYVPDSTSPIFQSFLSEVQPDYDVRNFLQEYVGYTLLSDARHELGIWQIGSGGDGKSTFARVVEAIHQRPVAMKLDALHGFNLSNLLGASLVVVDETPPKINEQSLKTLVSGQLIQIERKYRDAINFRPSAKWIISGNSLPAISDHSIGFWRRWVIVPFNHKPKKVIPLLAEKVIEDELAGVFSWAIDGLKRLLERGHFAELPDVLRDAIKHGKNTTNSVSAWVNERSIETGDQAKNKKEDVYITYNCWCKANGMQPVASTKFWERLRPILPDIYEWRPGGVDRSRMVNIYLP